MYVIQRGLSNKTEVSVNGKFISGIEELIWSTEIEESGEKTHLKIKTDDQLRDLENVACEVFLQNDIWKVCHSNHITKIFYRDEQVECVHKITFQQSFNQTIPIINIELMFWKSGVNKIPKMPTSCANCLLPMCNEVYGTKMCFSKLWEHFFVK